MEDTDWNSELPLVLGVQLNGQMIDEVDERGRTITGTTLLLLFNAEHEQSDFTLPVVPARNNWRPLLDTAQRQVEARRLSGGYVYRLRPRSMALFALQTIRSRLMAWLLKPQAPPVHRSVPAHAQPEAEAAALIP